MDDPQTSAAGKLYSYSATVYSYSAVIGHWSLVFARFYFIGLSCNLLLNPEPDAVVELQAGDLFYLPTGWIHEVTTSPGEYHSRLYGYYGSCHCHMTP